MPKVKREIKEIEHVEAPSGYVTLYNYKEPFMRFEGGHGFQGVLLFDGKTQKVQCHLCGEWMQYLPNHLHREHNMTAWAYKEKVGLRQTTALVSEELRGKLIANGMEARKKNLVPGGNGMTEETKQKIRETLSRTKSETQNDRGTCPLQLIDRLRRLHEKLGRTPDSDEITFYPTLVKVWGSLKDACVAAGIPYRKPGQNVVHSQLKYTDDVIGEWMGEFYQQNKKIPERRDFAAAGRENMYVALGKRTKSMRRDIIKKYCGSEGTLSVGRTMRYSDSDLARFMREFFERYQRDPTPSDTRRRLLPHYSTYVSRFGSWEKAKQLAIVNS